MSKVIGKNFTRMKRKLDSVGCGFCLAKMDTSYHIYMMVQLIHAHHPPPHKIGLRELKKIQLLYTIVYIKRN